MLKLLISKIDAIAGHVPPADAGMIDQATLDRWAADKARREAYIETHPVYVRGRLVR